MLPALAGAMVQVTALLLNPVVKPGVKALNWSDCRSVSVTVRGRISIELAAMITAPATVTTQQTATITVTSAADATKSRCRTPACRWRLQ